MKNTYKDAGYTYTINRLQETARTFRNLGDAYGETNQKQTGFKRQLILAADILEECVAMNLDAKAPDKPWILGNVTRIPRHELPQTLDFSDFLPLFT